ncbi:DNA polymerase beta superfamily protein, partial [Glycomyces tenuis]
LPLFAPAASVYASTELGDELRGLGSAFLSQRAARRFVGYLDGQIDRMLGHARGGKVPNRPELVERYGYDVKYASHALRLAYQGLEIAEHGRLTLPMPEAEREHVRRLKTGGVATMDDALDQIRAVRNRLVESLESGSAVLPAEPDTDRISVWSIEAHRRHWRDHHGF